MYSPVTPARGDCEGRTGVFRIVCTCVACIPCHPTRACGRTHAGGSAGAASLARCGLAKSQPRDAGHDRHGDADVSGTSARVPASSGNACRHLGSSQSPLSLNFTELRCRRQGERQNAVDLLWTRAAAWVLVAATRHCRGRLCAHMSHRPPTGDCLSRSVHVRMAV